MLEFIDGPCGWHRLAPARLRRLAVGVSTWQEYSTARCLDEEEDPIVLHSVGISDSPVDSSVNVELLPEAVARRWLNLEFATESNLTDVGFPEVLLKSLELVRTTPPLQGTVAGLCRSLHVLVAANRDFDVSYSDPSLPFSIFVSCPPPTDRNQVERLAENIVHEALHLQLTLVEKVEPLVVDAPCQAPVFSPWRNECRDVRGLIHAVYVFGNLRCFWKRVAVDWPDSSPFARTRLEIIDSELDATRQFVTNRFLTAMGRRLARSYLD